MLYSHARLALWYGVQALGLHPGDEILVPEYHCGTEIEALLRAGLGLNWYELDERLEPKEADLESHALGPKTRGLLLIHYLGFPQDAARWRRWCDERGLLLLEDAAQAWLASIGDDPVGSFGDLAIFSLNKPFGVPDGGALVSRVGAPKPTLSSPIGLKALLGRHAVWVAMKSSAAAKTLAVMKARNLVSRPEFDPDTYVALGRPDLPPLRTTLALLRRVADTAAAARRRDNYRRLLDSLGGLVPPPFESLPGGASPYMFPIKVARKTDVLHGLRRLGVHAINIWSVPHPSFPVERFPTAQQRRATTVGLPVHQELQGRDVDYIARAVGRTLDELELSTESA